MWTDKVNICPCGYPINSKTVNLNKIPVTHIPANEDSVDLMNEILAYIREDEDTWEEIEWAPKGGISVKHLQYPFWGVKTSHSRIELVIADWRIGMVDLVVGAANKDNTDPTGSESYMIFDRVCKRFDINLDDLKIQNGKEIKEQIPKPLIGISDTLKPYQDRVYGENGITFQNAHHLDINSAYLAGIAQAYPELRDPIYYVYDHRKDNNGYYKSVLTHSYGFFQSRWCQTKTNEFHENGKPKYVGYALAHLSKTAVEYTIKYLKLVEQYILEHGGLPILFNTDGLWYQSDKPIEIPDLYGKGLGQYKNDHVYCKLNIKSDGAYQFIEDGKCTSVLRGCSTLDRVKPREQWEWNDIYRGTEFSFKFDKSKMEVIRSGKDTDDAISVLFDAIQTV